MVFVFGFFLAYGMVEKDLSSPANDHCYSDLIRGKEEEE